MDLSNSKVIYLDVDGVLATQAKIKRVYNQTHQTRPPGIAQIDDMCVNILHAIVNKYHAKIVVSSTWRLLKADMDALRQAFSKYNMDIADVTPYSGHGHRGKEIESHMKANHISVENIVIIDDSVEDLQQFKDRIVQTDPEVGLQIPDMVKTQRIFESKGTAR